MSEYIEIEDAIETIRNALADIDDSLSDIAEHVIGYIEDLPSIDLVKCKECKKWTNGDDLYGICQWNDYRTLQTTKDSFCSCGEREGE